MDAKRLFTRRWRQYGAVIISTLAMFASGMHFTWTSPSLPKLYANDSSIPTSITQGSWLASISLLGDLIGAPAGAFIADYLGRKEAVFFTITPYLIAWIMIYFATSMEVLLLARFIVGISDGSTFTILPMYIGEIADNDIRGRLGNGLIVMCDFGALFMYSIGPYVSIPTMALMGATFPLLVYMFFPFFPESPYQCIMKGNLEKAKKSLIQFRGTDDVQAELDEITEVVHRQSKNPTGWSELFCTSSNLKALLILVGLKTAQQCSGISAVLVFTEIIFTDAGGYFSSAVSAIIVGCVQSLSSFFSAVIVDKVGRKPLLITSCAGCSITLFVVASYFYIKQSLDVVDDGVLTFLPIFGLVGFIISYSCGLGAIPYMMPSELFPTNIKAKALCLMDVYLALAAFFITNVYQSVAESFGTYVPFFFFSGSCIVSMIWIWLYIPETRGRSLEEIQDILKGTYIRK